MQKYLCIALILLISTPIVLYAKTGPKANPYLQGTVLAVQKQNVSSPGTMPGTTPSDAPLRSSYYAYNISVRVRCATYTARYDTPLNYLPSAFSPHHAIDLRLTKHVMYFNVPGEQEIRMPIVQRKNDGAGCSQSQ